MARVREVCGGESGHGARPMHPDWARSIRDQCVEANIPFLFKQWGEWMPRVQQSTTQSINFNRYIKSKKWGVLNYKGDYFPETTPWNGRQGGSGDNEYSIVKVGKKAAGRVLDGKIWDQYPCT